MRLARVTTALAVAMALALGACGNGVVVTASDVARSYVAGLAEGGFQAACAMLAPATRAKLDSSTRRPCAAVLARCLPESSTKVNHDQAQLLYVNTEPRVVGSTTDVYLSGLPVARELGEVTLIHRKGRWLMISPGKIVVRCERALHGALRKSRGRG